jgi:hypothetical protein
VDHVPRLQPVAARDPGIARGAAAQPQAFLLELRPGRAVDGTANPPPRRRPLLAALTIASTSSAVMSPWTTRIRAPAEPAPACGIVTLLAMMRS